MNVLHIVAFFSKTDIVSKTFLSKKRSVLVMSTRRNDSFPRVAFYNLSLLNQKLFTVKNEVASLDCRVKNVFHNWAFEFEYATNIFSPLLLPGYPISSDLRGTIKLRSLFEVSNYAWNNNRVSGFQKKKFLPFSWNDMYTSYIWTS